MADDQTTSRKIDVSSINAISESFLSGGERAPSLTSVSSATSADLHNLQWEKVPQTKRRYFKSTNTHTNAQNRNTCTCARTHTNTKHANIENSGIQHTLYSTHLSHTLTHPSHTHGEATSLIKTFVSKVETSRDRMFWMTDHILSLLLSCCLQWHI